jgi:hypothetical protein
VTGPLSNVRAGEAYLLYLRLRCNIWPADQILSPHVDLTHWLSLHSSAVLVSRSAKLLMVLVSMVNLGFESHGTDGLYGLMVLGALISLSLRVFFVQTEREISWKFKHKVHINKIEI